MFLLDGRTASDRQKCDAANSSFFSRNFANMPQMSGVAPPLQHMPSWRTHGFHENWRLPNSIKVCYACSLKFLVITWAVSRWSLVWKEPPAWWNCVVYEAVGSHDQQRFNVVCEMCLVLKIAWIIWNQRSYMETFQKSPCLVRRCPKIVEWNFFVICIRKVSVRRILRIWPANDESEKVRVGKTTPGKWFLFIHSFNHCLTTGP